MDVHWTQIADPLAYVVDILAAEAPDIPIDVIARGRWYVDDVRVGDLNANRALLERHDRDPLRLERRDRIEARIIAGEAIPPLIVLGTELVLVDGYARYRALQGLHTQRARVLRQDVGAECGGYDRKVGGTETTGVRSPGRPGVPSPDSTRGQSRGRGQKSRDQQRRAHAADTPVPLGRAHLPTVGS